MITFADEYVGYEAFKGVTTDEMVEAVKTYMDEGEMGSDVSYYGETIVGEHH